MTVDLKKKIYKWILLAALMFILTILESTVLSSFRVFNATPALIPFVVACVALSEGVEEGVIAGLLGGFLCDAMYSSHDGFYTLILPFLVYLVCLMNTVMYWKNFGMAVLDWAALSMLLNTAHFIIYMLVAGDGNFPALLRTFSGEFITTVPFTPFLYVIVKKIIKSFVVLEE
ncbi:MAG: rod shape-determining protein MreD [Oscillospiraceae bacterium]|nr:rod shape-determining protein MreD [Oscillospiraceae bacterium]